MEVVSYCFVPAVSIIIQLRCRYFSLNGKSETSSACITATGPLLSYSRAQRLVLCSHTKLPPTLLPYKAPAYFAPSSCRLGKPSGMYRYYIKQAINIAQDFGYLCCGDAAPRTSLEGTLLKGTRPRVPLEGTLLKVLSLPRGKPQTLQGRVPSSPYSNWGLCREVSPRPPARPTC